VDSVTAVSLGVCSRIQNCELLPFLKISNISFDPDQDWHKNDGPTTGTWVFPDRL